MFQCIERRIRLLQTRLFKLLRNQLALSYSGNGFSSIIMQRIENRAEEVISEAQAAFRGSSGNIDRMFTLRQTFETFAHFKDIKIVSLHRITNLVLKNISDCSHAICTVRQNIEYSTKCGTTVNFCALDDAMCTEITVHDESALLWLNSFQHLGM